MSEIGTHPARLGALGCCFGSLPCVQDGRRSAGLMCKTVSLLPGLGNHVAQDWAWPPVQLAGALL